MAVSRYSVVPANKAGGATYTPQNLADFVADQIVHAAFTVSRGTVLRVLDPATGDGELLVSLLGRLHSAAVAIQVHGFEIDIQALNIATARIRQRFPRVELHLEHKSFLDFVLENVRPRDVGSRFEQVDVPSYDLVVANPPYVRTQIMGADQAQLLARQFGLAGRVDLYHAFIVGIGHVLKRGGVAGIIVSNRFMTTRSGSAVRRAIREHFRIRHVWDLGDTKLFGATVLPAVLLVEKDSDRTHAPEFTSIYETGDEGTHQAADVIGALTCDGTVTIADGRRFTVRNGTLDHRAAPDAVWRVASREADGWLAIVKANTWNCFGDIGKIRVGVKTCADKVFIRSDWSDLDPSMRPELLRPVTTHHMARRFRAAPAKEQWQILYPHESVNGQRRPVDLTPHPRTRAYLEHHRKRLERRTYVMEGGREWYEIWVPQDPSRWLAPKLVFRDITEEPTFWLDVDGTIVNGDCYWLATNDPTKSELLWLAAAVANSSFVKAFYDHSFNNKLYAGRRRFITQYVERFPLPDPLTSGARRLVKLSMELYRAAGTDSAHGLYEQLDALVWECFGLSLPWFPHGQCIGEDNVALRRMRTV